MIHHIAIATPNLKIMEDFYRNLIGLNWLENKFTEDGSIRSAWFETEEKTLIMLESYPYSKSPQALVMKVNPILQFKHKNISITDRTDYTVYFLDPDNNRLGYSSYPYKLTLE